MDPCVRILERFGSSPDSGLVGSLKIGSRQLQKPWNSGFKQVAEDLDVWSHKKQLKQVFGSGFEVQIGDVTDGVSG